MEYKEFLKKELLDNSYGVYKKILDSYGEQMTYLETPARFRRWLAGELGTPIEAINLSSLNSALQQQRKKHTQANQQPVSSIPVNQSENKTGNFQFSKPSSDDKKPSRIREM